MAVWDSPVGTGWTPARPREPYAVDWRFLPEGFLLAKDVARAGLAGASNHLAGQRLTSGLWADTLGARTRAAVVQAGVLFIHIPKTGGTSISRRLYGRNLPHYTADFYRQAFGRALTDLPSFSVLRHPVERLISGYMFIRSGGTTDMAADRRDRAALSGLSSLDGFVELLNERRHRLDTLPLAFQEQTTFIADHAGAPLVDRLFAMSRAGGLPDEITEWLGLSGGLPRLNVGPDPFVGLRRATRRRIEGIYARDLALFEAVRAGAILGRAGAEEPAYRCPQYLTTSKPCRPDLEGARSPPPAPRSVRRVRRGPPRRRRR